MPRARNTAAALPLEVVPPCWHTGVVPDRSGMGRFTEMIRSPTDPDRQARSTYTPAVAAQRWKKELGLRAADKGKIDPRDWCDRIVELMKDGEPRTLNAISVLLVDLCADATAGSILGESLWSLVEARMFEHTCEAPIFFRRVEGPYFPINHAGTKRRIVAAANYGDEDEA